MANWVYPAGPLSEPDDLPIEQLEEVQEDKIYVASQSQLMWWKFRRHKMAVISGVIIIVLYVVAIFCEFFAPYDPEMIVRKYPLAPPVAIHVRDQQGHWQRPFVYGWDATRDPQTFVLTYETDYERQYPIRLFVRSWPYKLWGIFRSDVHLLGLDAPQDEQGVFVLGTDRLGRDLLSRIVYGARLSLSIGLVGIAFSFLLGISLGAVSGYYGGVIDTLIQRAIDFIRAIPSIPLWMALSAALPGDWPVIKTYFAITIILSLVGWTGLARIVRGRFLSLREEEFVLAARLYGAGETRVIFQHMLPSFFSYIIASMALSIPSMILGETGLSFIGLGLRPPAISWGVLLQDAQRVSVLATSPWLMIPGLLVILTTVAFNFFGDGLRDAADPYAR